MAGDGGAGLVLSGSGNGAACGAAGAALGPRSRGRGAFESRDPLGAEAPPLRQLGHVRAPLGSRVGERGGASGRGLLRRTRLGFAGLQPAREHAEARAGGPRLGQDGAVVLGHGFEGVHARDRLVERRCAEQHLDRVDVAHHVEGLQAPYETALGVHGGRTCDAELPDGRAALGGRRGEDVPCLREPALRAQQRALEPVELERGRARMLRKGGVCTPQRVRVVVCARSARSRRKDACESGRGHERGGRTPADEAPHEGGTLPTCRTLCGS